MQNIKIVTGGQTGVDRAALDFAMAHGIACGGFCPKGRKAEDGRIPDKYPLTELESKNYPDRTRKNIETSDATLILHLGKTDEGTKLTVNICKALKKKHLLNDLRDNTDRGTIIKWLESNGIRVLNIAGPRESNDPGIYKETIKFLTRYLGEAI